MVKRRTVVFMGLAFSVWAILATGMAGYYYLRFEDVMSAFQEIESSIIEVDFVIDYGNGTETWHNNTQLIAGETAFDALLAVATDVQYESSSWGVFITSINGRAPLVGENKFWELSFWNTTMSDWIPSSAAADYCILSPDDSIKFEFTSW